MPRFADGTPARGVPRVPRGPGGPGGPSGSAGGPGAPGGRRGPDRTPAQGGPRLPDGTPARGVPRVPRGPGGPAADVPSLPGGKGAPEGRRGPGGTPAQGGPRLPDGTPARGVPRVSGGTPSTARGAHPEQRESGGGWGAFPGAPAGGAGAAPQGPANSGAPGAPGATGPSGSQQAAGASGARIPRQRRTGAPRQEYLDAFDEDLDVFAPRSGGGAQEEPDRPGAGPQAAGAGEDDGGDAPPTGVPAQRGGKGRAFTGIAAAAVTTVLAVVVAGQVADDRDGTGVLAQSAPGRAHDARTSGRTAPTAAAPLTYEQKMDRTYPLSATLKGPGKFDAVPGFDKAPGQGRKFTYRVDVEQGLGLDGALFAEAVQKTLNDDRSWAHGGARTFERISSGKPDFVITLASPGTTAKWCAKSGLDTTEDNVSCDSAATERVMINAYRWAQGSKTYGNEIHAYRQMLINHEIGHRLGHGHVTCQKDGELAPVMQQQTKFLDHDGIHCLPNPWPYPKG
ncbi:DUF3152 domain-containing protein [Streptomyces bungoensis]|uniref:DUF3152 domain-containing protein n=1 Tax=Streptomyces bungoensis TaxID=285568 RepID=UPI003CC53AC8